jgi:type II secretory pathway pseudopilin PulG
MKTSDSSYAQRPSWIRRVLQWLFSWRTARRALIGLAVLATLTAVFYAEENWRGKHAWERCKRELEAQGVVLDWDKFIPPPVPDDQNFFKAPKMAEWFVGRGESELSRRLANTNTPSVGTDHNAITTPAAAVDYLKWSGQFEQDFAGIREALNRPYARIDTDYERPFEIAIPNFVVMRIVAQTLAQRAHCHLLLGQPEDARQDLTLLGDLCRVTEARPTGKPMTLVAAMINVAVMGLYVDMIAEGMRAQAWQEPQLAALQSQLDQINLLPIVGGAFSDLRAAVTHTLERKLGFGDAPPNLWNRLQDPVYRFLTLAPRGWIYQNMVASAHHGIVEAFDLQNNQVLPGKCEEAHRTFGSPKPSPYVFLAAHALPSFTRATQVLARNQTRVNQALLACALERYRLAHGQYPETLDALVPQFTARLPHDIIGGQPLKYHRTDDGKSILYSIGWNEKDDGGQAKSNPDGTQSLDQGDWVWP